MIKSRIILGMVCVTLITSILLVSGCVESVENVKGKKLTDRVGKIALIETDLNNLSLSYVCILDEDGVIYYPVYLNEQLDSLSSNINEDESLKIKIIRSLNRNNITSFHIVFSGKNAKDVDMGDKIGSPIYLTELDILEKGGSEFDDMDDIETMIEFLEDLVENR